MSIQKVKYHGIAWSLFMVFEYCLQAAFGRPFSLWQMACFYLLDILLFYLNFFLYNKIESRPKSFFRQLLFPLCTLSLVFVFIMSKWALRIKLGLVVHALDREKIFQQYLAASIFRGFIISIFSCAYWVTTQWIHKIRQVASLRLKMETDKRIKAELQSELVKAQNAWLRASINPHLLYNTLNFLYSRFSQDEQAKTAIELLVDVMRFSMSKPGTDGLVPIEKEWQQIENYIAIQQLRFSRRNNIEYTFINNKPGVRIPPVILLSLVENIYKYGNLEYPQQPARIMLITEGEGWTFSVWNRKRTMSHAIPSERLGMENVETRLKQIYGPSSYSLLVDNGDENYSLELKLLC